MIIDTSAQLAILRGEPEARSFARVIERANVRRLSAANYGEAGAFIDRSEVPMGFAGYQLYDSID